MNRRDFTKLMNARIKKIKGVLGVKGEVYAAGTDRLSNFKDAGVMLSCTPERALQGFMAKHQVALNDFIAQLDSNILTPLPEWEEKIGDIINYLILLEALIKERYSNTALSCVGTPAAQPTVQHSELTKSKYLNEPTLPGLLIPEDCTGPTELDMSQEVPGTHKVWKDAAGIPDPGAKVRIKAIGTVDGYYDRRAVLVGRTGVASNLYHLPEHPEILYGMIELDDDGNEGIQGKITFAHVQLEVQV